MYEQSSQVRDRFHIVEKSLLHTGFATCFAQLSTRVSFLSVFHLVCSPSNQLTIGVPALILGPITHLFHYLACSPGLVVVLATLYLAPCRAAPFSLLAD